MRSKVYEFLTSVLGFEPYQDFIPKEATYPAASYALISRQTERDMPGQVIHRRYTFSINVTSIKSRLECDAICDKLRNIDGVSGGVVRYFAIVSDTDSPRTDPDVSHYSTNIDFDVVI